MFRRCLPFALVLGIASMSALGEDPSASTPTPAFGDAPVKITLPDGTRALRVERLVKASIADVWNAWGTSEGLSKALGKHVTVEARIGGTFEILWKPENPEGQRGSEGCVVQAWIPQRLIAFTWNAPPQFGALRNEHSLVVVEMDEVGAGLVRMRLTHHGFGTGTGEAGGWDGIYDYFAGAWPHVMDTVCESLGGPLADARQKQQTWCYLIHPSRPDLLETMTDGEKQALGEHFAYLKAETAKGLVIFGGPCTDETRLGIVVYYADSPEDAKAFMEGDPAVKAGVFKAEVHPIAPSLIRERDRTKP